MTTPRKPKHRSPSVKREDTSRLRPDVVAAIERAWPDGVIEMSFDTEESWFCDAHSRLARAFQRLDGARLLYEREAELAPEWTDADDEDSPSDYEMSRSYHLFFLSPGDDAFTFESSTETEVEPEFDGDFEGQEFVGDTQMVTVPGEGRTGWSVAVSLIAPFAAIALSDYTVFEDGSVSEPAIERFAVDDDGSPINPEDHFQEVCGRGLFQKLEKLRTCIVGILEKQGVTVLPEAEWRKEVPWLRGDGDALAGDAVNQPVRVLDAFFFEGV
ncbi:MAG: hypothetical protein ABSC05_27070 [Candidatus Solibacter sp.]|jgi:hypothetical protein